MRMIQFEGRDYFDDRIYFMEVRHAASPCEKPWTVLMRRNTFGFPPVRADDFATWEEAVEYVRHYDPLTPLISLGGQSPNPPPSHGEYQTWLLEHHLAPGYIHPKE